MTKALTSTQAQRYQSSGANKCPYCESPDISANDTTFDGLGAWQTVECLACGERWMDHYEMVGVSGGSGAAELVRFDESV